MNRYTWLSITLLATCLCTPAQAAENALTRQQDKFHRLATAVALADDGQRQDFAWIAIAEVTRAYEQEFSQSQDEALGKAKAQRKLARWRKGTRSFIEQLHQIQALLGNPAEIDIHGDVAGPPVLFINDNPIVISGPGNGMQRLLEQRIIDTYCELHDCTEIFAEPEPPAIVPEPVEPGGWSLGSNRRPRYETPDGLVFLFSNLQERNQKQKMCETLGVELRRLVAGLRNAERAGYPIEWQQLQINSLELSDNDHLLLNRQGDYLPVALPVLERTGLVQGEAMEWIQQRFAKKNHRTLFRDADRLYATYSQP